LAVARCASTVLADYKPEVAGREKRMVASFVAAAAAISAILGFFDLIGRIRNAVEISQKGFDIIAERQKVKEAPVRIILFCGEDFLLLPYEPPRFTLSRGELFGLMGSFYGPGRFDQEGLVKALLNGELKKVQSAEKDDLRIEVLDSDFQKFRYRVLQLESEEE
jgi:hypothetical protein